MDPLASCETWDCGTCPACVDDPEGVESQRRLNDQRSEPTDGFRDRETAAHFARW